MDWEKEDNSLGSFETLYGFQSTSMYVISFDLQNGPVVETVIYGLSICAPKNSLLSTMHVPMPVVCVGIMEVKVLALQNCAASEKTRQTRTAW